MSALGPRNSIVIQNDSGMVIPKRSVVVVVSVETIPPTNSNEATTITHVDQYGCGKPGNILVTGGISIARRAKGLAYIDPLVYVSIDPSISDPAPGEEWGPSDGSWVLTRSNKTRGFFAQGHSDNQ
jgi:hypothetical protein